jgi:hypothetical protein
MRPANEDYLSFREVAVIVGEQLEGGRAKVFGACDARPNVGDRMAAASLLGRFMMPLTVEPRHWQCRIVRRCRCGVAAPAGHASAARSAAGAGGLRRSARSWGARPWIAGVCVVMCCLGLREAKPACAICAPRTAEYAKSRLPNFLRVYVVAMPRLDTDVPVRQLAERLHQLPRPAGVRDVSQSCWMRVRMRVRPERLVLVRVLRHLCCGTSLPPLVDAHLDPSMCRGPCEGPRPHPPSQAQCPAPIQVRRNV